MIKKFLPTLHGLKFVNDPPPSRFLLFGNTANGMCGGMVFLSLDYFIADKTVPADTDFPEVGSSLFNKLKSRFADSVHIPFAIPKLWWNSAFMTYSITFKEICKITKLLEKHPIPIILLKINTLNPFKLGHQHQVLVYYIKEYYNKIRLLIYDPNYPCDNDVYIDFYYSNYIIHSKTGECYGFYANKYRFKEV